MKIGDTIVITQIAKEDDYYPDREKLLGQPFMITRIGFYWGGGWRALGLKRLTWLHPLCPEFYCIRVKLIREEVTRNETVED